MDPRGVLLIGDPEGAEGLKPFEIVIGWDARGNQTVRDAPGSANDRTIRYSLDDHAYEIVTGNGQRTRYWYGPDGQRYQREDADGTRTLYIGQVEVLKQGATTRYRRNLGGVLVRTEQGSSAEDRFVFTDRLGSVVKYTDGNGTVYQPQDFDGWGGRRSTTDPTQAGSAPTPPIGLRGYTGQEMVDGQDVIHMNARLYDPVLGRFLQADPLIQAPENLQSWNAYTYVLNNPLTLVDPTGMFSIGKLFRQLLSIAVTIVANILVPGMSIWGAMLTGFISGAISSGSLQGGLIGAFSAGLFHGIGTAFGKMAAANGGSLSSLQTFGKILAHGIAGGVMSVLQGGKFGSGFMSAGFVEMAGPLLGDIHSTTGQVVAAAIIGGTASVLSGGKFGNGALTGAFSYAFNQVAHRYSRLSADEAREVKDAALRYRTKIARMSDKEFLTNFPNTMDAYAGYDEMTAVWLARQELYENLRQISFGAGLVWATKTVRDAYLGELTGNVAESIGGAVRMGYNVYQFSSGIKSFIPWSEPNVWIACRVGNGCYYNVP